MTEPRKLLRRPAAKGERPLLVQSGTFAGASGNGQDAPKAVFRATAFRLPQPTQTGRRPPHRARFFRPRTSSAASPNSQSRNRLTCSTFAVAVGLMIQ